MEGVQTAASGLDAPIGWRHREGLQRVANQVSRPAELGRLLREVLALSVRSHLSRYKSTHIELSDHRSLFDCT